MYEQFFGLSEKPFSIQPDPSFLYWGRTHRLAYAMLEYGVLNHAGISVVTGEVGCGKTTLIHRLLDQLSDTHTVALLSNIQEGRGDLLSWVLMGFGQEFASKSHVELFSELQSFFISEYAKGKRVVMIIDEAQNLSLDMLEELRMLSNINAGKDQLLQLILVGQPQLKEKLNQPELLQLAQRVGSDFHLTPLSKEEVHAYVETRLAIAGCRRRIFTDRAIDLIAEKSRGVPRIINVVADTALVYAFSSEELVVGVDTVRSVVRDKTDYGVFGLASDDGAALPMEPQDTGQIDAFSSRAEQSSVQALSSTALNSPDQSADEFEPERHVANSAPQVLTAKPANESEPVNVAPNTQKPAVEENVAGAVTELQSKPVATKSAHKTIEHEDRNIEREATAETGVVVLCRNPKTSPEAAIRSIGDGRAIVFVSTANAQQAIKVARESGAVVVNDAANTLNTAGRARNAGYRQLKKIAPHLKYVQFVDAAAAIDPDWISSAERFMERRPEVAVIEGHMQSAGGVVISQQGAAKRNLRLADGEIQTTTSGSAFVRADAFEAIGGFRGDLEAASLTDLCIRQRRRGGRIWRLDSTMALQQPTERGFSGWWSKKARLGFVNAYRASIHGGPPERLGVFETISAVFWGFGLPLIVVLFAAIGAVYATTISPSAPGALIVGGVGLVGAVIYLFRIILAAGANGLFNLSSWNDAIAKVVGSFPEFSGVLKFVFGERQPGPAT